MSLEAIKQVAEAEELTKLKKAEAQIAAKQLVADAEKNGKAALDKARAEAEAQAKAMMAEAEENARVYADQVVRETEADKEALRRAAELKLEEAAALIVERVVKN